MASLTLCQYWSVLGCVRGGRLGKDKLCWLWRPGSLLCGSVGGEVVGLGLEGAAHSELRAPGEMKSGPQCCWTPPHTQ